MMNCKYLSAALLCLSASVHSAVFTYSDFSNTNNLTLNGDAQVVGNVLRLTDSADYRTGSVFSTSLIDLNAGSFSSEFSFNFNNQRGGGADGIVFTLQSVSNQVGSTGGGIGYENIPNSIGIEFDNWNNGSSDGFSDSHIGLNLNGSISSIQTVTTSSLGLGNLDTASTIWYAWVNYNNVAQQLDVFFSDQDVLPSTSALSYTGDLAALLGTNQVYAGFTSATGGAYANHDLLSWEFSDTASGTSSFSVPAPATGTLLLTGLFLLVRRKFAFA